MVDQDSAGLVWDSCNLEYLKQQEGHLTEMLKNTLSHIDGNGLCDISDRLAE